VGFSLRLPRFAGSELDEDEEEDEDEDEDDEDNDDDEEDEDELDDEELDDGGDEEGEDEDICLVCWACNLSASFRICIRRYPTSCWSPNCFS